MSTRCEAALPRSGEQAAKWRAGCEVAVCLSNMVFKRATCGDGGDGGGDDGDGGGDDGDGDDDNGVDGDGGGDDDDDNDDEGGDDDDDDGDDADDDDDYFCYK